MPLSVSEGLCVLVADDEAPARQRIIDLLRGDSRVAAITEAWAGLSAVDIIQNRKPDLVFLDVQMPELNGLQVIAEVRTVRKEFVRRQRTSEIGEYLSPSRHQDNPCRWACCKTRVVPHTLAVG